MRRRIIVLSSADEYRQKTIAPNASTLDKHDPACNQKYNSAMLDTFMRQKIVHKGCHRSWKSWGPWQYDDGTTLILWGYRQGNGPPWNFGESNCTLCDDAVIARFKANTKEDGVVRLRDIVDAEDKHVEWLREACALLQNMDEIASNSPMSNAPAAKKGGAISSHSTHTDTRDEPVLESLLQYERYIYPDHVPVDNYLENGAAPEGTLTGAGSGTVAGSGAPAVTGSASAVGKC